MRSEIFKPEQFKTLPWKNGKGSTSELLFENVKQADEFAWRLSMAPVTADGEFSDFEGYDRKLILLKGEGITLTHDSGQIDGLHRRFDMACFDGGCGTKAVLHGSEIIDFNVMTRQGICDARVNVFREISEHRITVDAAHLLIIGFDDEIEIISPALHSITVPAMHLLQLKSPDGGLYQIKGGAFICIQIVFMEPN